MKSSTHSYGAGSTQVLSGTPAIVGIAKTISELYSDALSDSINYAVKEASTDLKEAAKNSQTLWNQLANSVEVWYQEDTDSVHYGVRTSADDAALAMKLEYGDAKTHAPNPLLRSHVFRNKDAFAKRVSQLLDAALSRKIK
jgi:hypothetical protein